MRKYGESKTTRIMMGTVPHVTSGLGLRKFQADGFLLTRVCDLWQVEICGCVDAELEWSQETHYCRGKPIQFVSLEYPTSALVCN